ncbi:hypothetical protein [Tardiphaga sp. 841_E9_N1_2]|uniref:hypothetical protein n=1 Tax=Tardiphaga sp. 841_E9_N1_2 TaxID=3240762 RepID=UPI003F21CDD1
MDNGNRAVSSTVKRKSSGQRPLPWRPFRDRPSGIWIDETVTRIKETAQPELIDSLFRNQISKHSRFNVLRHLITVDGKKRPEGDSCPCPMCTPNRFLTGSLVWFPDLQCCAFIGNCCADDDVLAEAQKEWKRREKKRFEEDYLLDALPLVGQKLEILEMLKPIAHDAVRTYRRVRNTLPQVHEQLRRMKQHHGGQLTLTEILRDESREKNDDYFGPAGFKGRGKDGVETRDHTFGTFSGQIAVHKDYNPAKELETIHRSLVSVASNSYGQEPLDFICAMTDKQRHAAVVILQSVEDSIVKFKARLQDLALFITPENADKFNRYFTHELNSLYFRVDYTNGGDGPALKFKRGASIYSMVRGSWAGKLEFEWPKKG